MCNCNEMANTEIFQDFDVAHWCPLPLPPEQPNIFSTSCSLFLKIWQNRMLAPPEGRRPLLRGILELPRPCRHYEVIWLVFMVNQNGIWITDICTVSLRVAYLLLPPPTKLREGNVFSRVCLSVHVGDSHVTITHDALDLTTQTWNPYPWACSNLFILDSQHPPSLLLPRAVDKRMVRILLECFLVLVCDRLWLFDCDGCWKDSVASAVRPWIINRNLSLKMGSF